MVHRRISFIVSFNSINQSLLLHDARYSIRSSGEKTNNAFEP